MWLNSFLFYFFSSLYYKRVIYFLLTESLMQYVWLNQVAVRRCVWARMFNVYVWPVSKWEIAKCYTLTTAAAATTTTLLFLNTNEFSNISVCHFSCFFLLSLFIWSLLSTRNATLTRIYLLCLLLLLAFFLQIWFLRNDFLMLGTPHELIFTNDFW